MSERFGKLRCNSRNTERPPMPESKTPTRPTVAGAVEVGRSVAGRDMAARSLAVRNLRAGRAGMPAEFEAGRKSV